MRRRRGGENGKKKIKGGVKSMIWEKSDGR